METGSRTNGVWIVGNPDMRILGVDPGLSGALCVLDKDADALLFIEDMPVVEKQVNAQLLSNSIYRLKEKYDFQIAAVEAVHSMPRQGVASSFKFGVNYGMILGILGAFEIPVRHVIPHRWTTDLRVGPSKDKHRQRAIERWPSWSESFKRVKDEGRADAALIAHWLASCG